MSSAVIGIPPPRGPARFTEDQSGILTLDAIRTLLPVFNANELVTLDTTTGSADFSVPLAGDNQNQELVFVKISSDANTPTLVVSGNDLINGAASHAVGTAQYSTVRLKSDGQTPGNWYIVG